jgi:hypothetical protein
MLNIFRLPILLKHNVGGRHFLSDDEYTSEKLKSKFVGNGSQTVHEQQNKFFKVPKKS